MPGATHMSESISGFDPRSVADCIVWLDAADISTLTLSGTNVTGWRDKSIYANNVNSISATPPTYSSADSSINFVANSSTFLRGALSATYSNATVFMIVSIATNPAPAFPRLSILSNSATANSQLIGQLFLVNGNNPSVATYLSTNTNPTGQGTNFISFINNVTFNTKQLISNSSTYVGTAYTVSTLLNGNTQATSSTSGTFSANSSYTANYNKYTLGNYADASAAAGDALQGKIFEYIVFSRELTTSQRQAIEGYLAWKWGIQTVSTKNLITTHPFYYNRVFSRVFQPVDIPGCMIWLDGADSTTMTPTNPSNGTTITAWRDKACLMYSSGTTPYSFTPGAIQTASSNGTVYTVAGPTYVTGGGVFFSNSSGLLGNGQQGLGLYSSALNSSPLFTMPTQAMTIVVASLPATNTIYRRIAWLGSYQLGGATLPNFLMGPQMGAYEGGTLAYDYNGSAWSQLNYGSSGYNSNAVLRVDVMISGPGASQWWWTNGTLNTFNLGSNVYTSLYSNYPVNFFFLASYTSTIDGNRNFHGTIYEVLLYNTAITTAQRQQIEGYLAWKWGFRTSLIAGHPYGTIPPSSALPFTPTSIIGCQLWMDAAQDTSANNATITTIPDRSGNGITLTAIGTITLYQNYKNGNPVYYFYGNRASNANFNWGTNFTHFVVSSTVSGAWLNSVGTLNTYVGLGNWALVNINSAINFVDPGSITTWSTSGSVTTGVSASGLPFVTLPVSTTSGSATTTYTTPINSVRQTSFSLVLPSTAGLYSYFGLANGTTTLQFLLNTSGGVPSQIYFFFGGNPTLNVVAGSTVFCSITNTSLYMIVYPSGSNVTVSWTNSGAAEYYMYFSVLGNGANANTTTYANIQFDPAQGGSILPKTTGLANAWNITSVGYTSGSTRLTNYAVNGTPRSSTTSTAHSGQTPVLPLYINGSSGGAYDTSYFAEIIHYNVALTTTERQQVEGYLAAKWGILLTSNHPYYRIPSIQQYTNIGITTTGLILNLDPRSYTASASTWVPYVGNTWNVVNSPTVSQLNGYNILTFNGTNQYCFDPTGVNFQGAYSINIWINLAAVSTAGNVLTETNGGYQWTNLYITGSTLYVGSYQINNVSLGAPVEGAWYNVCITNSASGSSSLVTYLNGVYYSTTSYTRTSPGANSFIYITSSSGNVNYGYKALSLGVMCFYTVALTYQDVKQNYNALCWRYGLSPVNS